MTGTGTDIKVWRGGTALAYHASNASTFSVAVTDDTNITVNASPSTVSTYTRRYGVHTGLASGTSDITASITYAITVRDAAGGTTVINKLQTFSKSITGTTGATGAGTNFIFKRAATNPNPSSGPTADGLNVPSGWDDTPGQSSNSNGEDILWASKGTLSAGGTAYSWSVAYRVEGSAVAELRIYSDVVASNGSSPSKPSTNQSTFDFTDSSITINNSSWNTTPPSVTNNGDTVYSVSSLISGSPSDTSVGITWAGTPTIFARKTDGTTPSTPADGTRGYSIFTIEESTDSNTSAANAANWVGTLNDSNANDIAGAVIALADDNYIRPNDRITVTDNSASTAGTRIYTGSATGTETNADAANFSSLVTETFPGSVIVDGTLAAAKLTSGFVYTKAMTVGSNDNVFKVDTAGNIHSGLADNSGGAAPFQVSNAGVLSLSGANSSITIGSSNNIFKATSTGVQLGNTTFTSAPFRVTAAGALNAESVTLKSTSGTALDIGSGATSFKVFTPSSGTSRILTVGGTASQTHIPLTVSNDGTGNLQGFNIFTVDGTKLIDATTGFTDNVYTEIAQTLGTAVTTVSKTSSNVADADGQKITLDAQQNLTIKVRKSSNMFGFDLSSNEATALANAKADIPDQFTLQIYHSLDSDFDNASDISSGGKTFYKTTSSSQGTDKYRLTTWSESEPGFTFAEASILRAAYDNDDVIAADDYFEKSITYTANADEHWFWAVISGGSGGNGVGANNVSNTAATRVLEITAAAGESFYISSDGDGSEAGGGDITAVVAGTGLTGGASSGSATLNVSGLTVSEFAGSAIQTGSESFADNDTSLMTSAAVQDKILSYGYGTGSGSGDITAVVAGTYMSGGATSGSATINHGDTSSQASVNNSGRTYIQDITLDGAGHVTAIASATETVTDTDTWRGIDDTPVDGQTAESISSNWAYDHNAGTGNSKHVPAAGSSGTFLAHDGVFRTPSYTSNTDTNYYLDNITKSGNTLTFVMSGKADETYTFGSNAFNSTNIPTDNNQIGNSAGYTTNTGTTTASNTQTFTNKSGNISQWTNDSLYTTNTGTVTSVATGNGLSGGAITTTGTLTMSGSYSGNFAATGNVTAYSSDERLKDLRNTISKPLDKIKLINGYEFEWNDKARKLAPDVFKEGIEVGVSAQELQKVIPSVVKPSLHEGYLTVQYEKIVPLLIEAIKELKEEVDKLKENV